MRRAAFCLAAAVCLLGAPASGSIMEELEKECVEVLQRVQPSVVSIITVRENPAPAPGQAGPAAFEHFVGSGLVMDGEQHVLTTGSVVAEALQIHAVLQDGRRVPARVVGVDRAGNLAVLKLEVPALRPVRWGDSDDVHPGSWVVAVGNSTGPLKSVAFGMVAGRSSHLELGPLPDYIQMNVAVSPGDSGGAVANARGEVVGVVTAVLDNQGDPHEAASFAIPANQAREIGLELIRNGRVARGWLGATVSALTPEAERQIGSTGLLALDVLPGGPAAAGGIQPGDVLTSYAGQPLRDLADLHRLVAGSTVGSLAPVTVTRQGRPVELVLRITAAPDSGAPPEPPELTDTERHERDLMRYAGLAFGERVEIDYASADHEVRRKLAHFFWSHYAEGSRDEMVRRLEHVRDSLGTAGRPGLMTDRGKIYVQYGPPDRIVAQRPRRGGSLLDSTADLADAWYYDRRQVAFLFGPSGDFLEGNEVASTVRLE